MPAEKTLKIETFFHAKLNPHFWAQRHRIGFVFFRNQLSTKVQLVSMKFIFQKMKNRG